MKNISKMSVPEYLEMRRQNSLRNAIILATIIFVILAILWYKANAGMWGVI